MQPDAVSSSAQRRPNRGSTIALPSILTLREVATQLRCSKAHLSHIVNGKVAGLPPLPVARIGRRVIIRREALLNWLWTVEGRDETMDADLNSSLETHGKE